MHATRKPAVRMEESILRWVRSLPVKGCSSLMQLRDVINNTANPKMLTVSFTCVQFVWISFYSGSLWIKIAFIPISHSNRTSRSTFFGLCIQVWKLSPMFCPSHLGFLRKLLKKIWWVRKFHMLDLKYQILRKRLKSNSKGCARAICKRFKPGKRKRLLHIHLCRSWLASPQCNPSP